MGCKGDRKHQGGKRRTSELLQSMLTNPHFNEVSTELFFKNAFIHVDLCHRDEMLKEAPTLHIFGHSWYLKPTGVMSRRVEEATWASLTDFLRKVEHVSVAMRSRSLLKNKRALKINSLGDARNAAFQKLASFLVRALNTSPQLTEVVLKVVSDDVYMARLKNKKGLSRLGWHFNAFESLMKAQLSIEIVDIERSFRRLEVKQPVVLECIRDTESKAGKAASGNGKLEGS